MSKENKSSKHKDKNNDKSKKLQLSELEPDMKNEAWPFPKEE